MVKILFPPKQVLKGRRGDPPQSSLQVLGPENFLQLVSPAAHSRVLAISVAPSSLIQFLFQISCTLKYSAFKTAFTSVLSPVFPSIYQLSRLNYVQVI